MRWQIKLVLGIIRLRSRDVLIKQHWQYWCIGVAAVIRSDYCLNMDALVIKKRWWGYFSFFLSQA